MTTFLTRARQFGAKIETTPGTYEVLAAADFAGGSKDTVPTTEITEYERGVDLAGTITELANITALGMLTLKTTKEVTGGGAATRAPIHDCFRACGFAKVQLKYVTVGSVVGTFKAGETFGNNASLGSATKTGRVVMLSSTKLVYEPLTGTFSDTDSLTAYTSATTATVSGAAANAGYGFNPISESDSVSVESLTAEVRIAGQIHRAVGAVGKVQFEIKHGQPVLAMFEFQGLPAWSGGAPVAGSAMASVPALGAAPKLAKGFPVLLDDLSPVCTGLTVNVDNTITPRPTLGTGSGTVTDIGFFPPRISKRKVTMTADPEQPAVATKEFYGLAAAGTQFPVYIQAGAPTDTNGAFVIFSPTVQVSGNQEPSDRDGIVIRNLSLHAVGSGDDEIRLWHVFL